VRLCLQKELLQGSVELSNSLLFVDSWIALQSFHRGVESKCQGLRKLRLATTWRALNQNRLLQLARDVHLGERYFINDVPGFLEFLPKLIDRRKHVGLYPQPEFYANMRFSPKNQAAWLKPMRWAEILGIAA